MELILGNILTNILDISSLGVHFCHSVSQPVEAAPYFICVCDKYCCHLLGCNAFLIASVS